MTYSYYQDPKSESIIVYENPDEYRESDNETLASKALVSAISDGETWIIQVNDPVTGRIMPTVTVYGSHRRSIDRLAHVLAHGLIATREGATTSATAPSGVEGLLEVGTGRGWTDPTSVAERSSR